MIFKRGTLQKSRREVLREIIFENKNIIFLINNALTEIYYLTFYCFKSVCLGRGSS